MQTTDFPGDGASCIHPESSFEKLIRLMDGYGVHSDYLTLWIVRPDLMADQIERSAKNVAKLVHKSRPSLSHCQCLEAIGVACGLPHWRALTQQIKGLLAFEESNHLTLLGWVETRPHLLRMLALADPERSPQDSKAKGCLSSMESFAKRLADSTGIPLDDALRIQARRCKCDSWEALVARKAGDQPGDVMTFETSSDGKSGEFRYSEKGRALSEDVERLFSRYEFCSPSEASNVAATLLEMLRKNSDLLVGWNLCLEMLDDQVFAPEDEDPVFDAAVSALKKAEKLIPKGFRGETSWLFIENRPYLSLLYGLMRQFSLDPQDGRKALAMARKLRRLDRRDSQGARYWEVALCLRDGDLAGAKKASAFMRDPEMALNAQDYFLMSVLNYRLNDREGFVRDFSRALIEFPWIMRVINGLARGKRIDAPSDEDTRLVTPDPRCFLDHCFMLLDGEKDLLQGMASIGRAAKSCKEVVEHDATWKRVRKTRPPGSFRAFAEATPQVSEALVAWVARKEPQTLRTSDLA